MNNRKMFSVAILAIMIAVTGMLSAAAPSPSVLEWKAGDAVFSGLYYPGKKDMPAVVIFHQWLGVSLHEKRVAEELNAVGYTVLAADLYGKGVVTSNPDEARKRTAAFYADRGLFRARTRAALDALTGKSGIGTDRIFAIGYCFGGTAALELGRDGAVLAGIVSLHGGLSTPKPDDNGRISSRVLILHGAEDQAVTWADVTAFTESMRGFKKDFSLHVFSGAVHGFTHKNDPARYNEAADKASWNIMLDFFKR